MSRRSLILIAAGGSAALLLGALGFQYLGGMAPCKLCFWQRYPHVAAIALGAIAMIAPGRFWPFMGMLAALTTAALGVYHTGVEKGWWEGPTTCTSSGTEGLTADELFDQIMAAPVIRCDEIAWELLGLSMASWNAVMALILAGIWYKAIRAS